MWQLDSLHAELAQADNSLCSADRSHLYDGSDDFCRNSKEWADMQGGWSADHRKEAGIEMHQSGIPQTMAASTYQAFA